MTRNLNKWTKNCVVGENRLKFLLHTQFPFLMFWSSKSRPKAKLTTRFGWDLLPLFVFTMPSYKRWFRSLRTLVGSLRSVFRPGVLRKGLLGAGCAIKNVEVRRFLIFEGGRFFWGFDLKTSSTHHLWDTRVCSICKTESILNRVDRLSFISWVQHTKKVRIRSGPVRHGGITGNRTTTLPAITSSEPYH